MGRNAILLANSVAYADTTKGIPRGVIKSYLKELAGQLESLEGEYSFDCESIVDHATVEAREKIRRNIRTAGKHGNQFLFYYFGHAISHPFKDELYFLSPDSDTDDLGGMLKFSDVLGWLAEYQPFCSIIILDCCYAGTAAHRLRLTNLTGNYYLMASVNAKDKALLDYHVGQAYGVFSKYVLQAFTDPHARDQGRDVTFKSFFNYAKKRTESALGQKPYSLDGNLADEIFFRQTSTPNIPESAREDVPKKSIYRKLFIISRELMRNSLQSERFLYGYLKKRGTTEFLQPRKTHSNVVEYEFVSEEAFHRYVRIGAMLGIIDNRGDSLLRLTARGRDMMIRNGRMYNRGLYDALLEFWIQNGLNISVFEDAIYVRIRGGDAPTLERIHRDLTYSGLVRIPKQLFRVLFELTGFVGALNYSGDKTFFPPASAQEKLTVS
jgi:hypothetical protein